VRGKGAGYSLLVSLSVLGLCLPQPLWASDDSVAQKAITTNVSIKDGGVLIGLLLDAEGHFRTDVPVSVRRDNEQLVEVVTNEQGYFAVCGLRGGKYQLVVDEGKGRCQLWTLSGTYPVPPEVAPPVPESRILRGQCGRQCGGPSCYDSVLGRARPWFIAGVIATAIAVPVGLHNSRHPASP